MATLSKKRVFLATIGDRTVPVEPRETVLAAALRAGVDFPSSCRVGGCGACKCRLTEGEVDELTETGYLLTGEEIERGTILACQSVPRTDVRVELDQPASRPVRRAGRVVAQERVTHDITRIAIAIDEPLPFQAGQFASLTLGGVTRRYSFASPSEAGAPLTFLVRKVSGGELSPRLCDDDLIGRAVEVEGPHGDFVLGEGDGPLLFVAGGSGLAPVLAILEEAARAGSTRSVTVLFGAREERDLYASAELADLAARWRAPFRSVPVLSEAPSDAAWAGARGLVTSHVAAHLEPGAEAYLCGPPPMVDAARAELAALGVERVRFDRFTTLADAAREAPRLEPEGAPSDAVAGPLHYLKYFGFHLVGLAAAASILAGGAYTTLGLASVLALYMLGDALLGDDTSTPKFAHPRVLTAQLWLALPLLVFIVLAAVWSVSPGDPLHLGALVGRLTHYDAIAARDATGVGHHVSAFVLTGLMIGMVGTIPGHELTHRTWDPVSMAVGRWLLAFSFDTSFAIEHVYGHHRYVSTTSDPATAPRGRNVYFHVVASTIKGNVSAWRIEAARLRKRKLSVWSFRNAFLRGHLTSLALVAIVLAVFGVRAAAFFVACGLWGKALLEIVNYMEHYGMVRAPETPVAPRHSWNTNRRVSSWTMFNLTRHSHHHAQGEVAYQDLRPYPGAPMMINGYLTTLVVAMIPPLWHHLMTPKVLAWDRDFATDEERALAARANRESGVAAFERAAGAGASSARPRLPRAALERA
jgi:NAD(P)H-flavin reductase/ferredoxin/fatty-acid desaturase